jgi:hypothetical protein
MLDDRLVKHCHLELVDNNGMYTESDEAQAEYDIAME